MRVRVVRDARLTPGAERRHVCPSGVTWVVSTRGLSQAGADAVEAMWDWLLTDGGLTSDDLKITAVHDPEPEPDVPLKFELDDDGLLLWFHPGHVDRATLNGSVVEHRQGRETVSAR